MIIDSSALVAIVLREPGYDELLQLLMDDPAPAIGAATLLEAGIVLSARLGVDARAMVTRILHEGGVTVLPVTDEHFGLAMEAWLRFGKGRHPAALNFGDCLSYALAIVAGTPLLAVGDDFPLTDCALA